MKRNDTISRHCELLVRVDQATRVPQPREAIDGRGGREARGARAGH